MNIIIVHRLTLFENQTNCSLLATERLRGIAWLFHFKMHAGKVDSEIGLLDKEVRQVDAMKP